MKHFAYTLLGIALLMSASCAKMEENAVPAQSDSFRIKATIDNLEATKTAYTEDQGYKTAHISWMAGDQFKLVVFNKSTHGADFYRCNVDESTINDGYAEFELYGTFNEDNFTRAGYAVYPSDLTIGGNEDDGITVTLPAAYSVSGTDLTQVKVPLIGVQQTDNDHAYDFFNAVGVLKITLTDVPVSARKVVLVSEHDNLSGTFPLNQNNGFTMVGCAPGTGGHSITVNISQQTAGSTISVYMPVPVGHISAGAYFEVQTIDGTAIKTTEVTKKDIPVVKGHLLPLPAISVEDWESLGIGKFVDNHTFYQASNWCGASDLTANTYFDVEIQRHKTETNRYRVVNPYGPMFDTYGATQTGTGPNDYLTLTVRNDIGTDIILNDSFHTGIDQYGPEYYGTTELWYDNPYWWSLPLYHNNRIINKDSEGNILNIQLAPFYKGGYDEDCSQNPKIEIVFPGSTPMMAGVFNYADGATASYSDGVVTVGISNSTITGVKVKAAATIDAGVAALQAGEQDLTFTTSGSLDLNLPLGTYYLIYKVETDGHGYVYKNAGQYDIATEIPLNASMVSVNVDAGDKDGNHYDGGGEGALVDNDITTFWHTPWLTADGLAYYQEYGYYTNVTGEPYLYTDLDPVYGAYIDIDLGASKTVTTFQVRACLRNCDNDHAKHVIVYTSADNSSWAQVAEVENICAGIAKGTWINPITCNSTAARYVRFSIIGNASNKDLRVPSDEGCTHLAEIKLFE